MRTSKKILISILIFLICFSAVSLPSISAYLSYINDSSVIPDDYDKYDGNIDTLFLGASYTRVAVDIEKYESTFATNAYSYTSNRMYMPSNYYSLCKIIKTNKIKKLYLELSYENLFFDPYDSIEAIVNYYELLPENSEKITYSLRFAGINNYTKLLGYLIYTSFPILAKNEIHGAYVLYKKLTSSAQGINPNAFTFDEAEITKGFMPNRNGIFSDVKYADYKEYYHSESREIQEVNKTQKKYLDKIIEICKAEDIDVTFIVYPVTDYYSILFDNNNLSFEKACEDISKETGYPVFDFNLIKDKTEIFNDTNDFYNRDHLTYSGAEKLTDLLIEVCSQPDYDAFTETYSSLEETIMENVERECNS